MRHLSAVGMAAALALFGTLDATAGPRNEDGEWSAVYTLPMVPSSGALLPDGKVLLWSANRAFSFWEGELQVHTAIYNPVTNTHTYRVQGIPHNMFCTGTTQMPDGSILANGGTQTNATSIWDPAVGEWTVAADMNVPRGYNANTLLQDGSVLTLGGSWSGGMGGKIGEVYKSGSWRRLNDMTTDSMDNPETDVTWAFDSHFWLVTAGNGRVFYPGPGVDMQWLDTRGNGAVTAAGKRGNDRWAITGLAVMFDQGKILTAGGSHDYDDVDSSKAAHVIDINGPARVTRVSDMTYGRAFVNGTVLPDGKVVMVGGQSFMKGFEDSDSVLAAEIWDPATGRFSVGASASVPRNYHSISLLLPDGRVLSGGGGLCGDCTTNHPDFQIYSPPYLFNASGGLAARPEIVTAPDALEFGETITVTTDRPVEEFSMVRFSAVTHSINNDQRRLSLTSRLVGTNRYEIDVPTNPGWMLPGNWMLFAMNSAGTPSVAHILRVKTNRTVNIASPFEVRGRVGDAIEVDVSTVINAAPVTFSGRGLPDGVTIDRNTGAIRGTPQEDGTFRASIIGTGPAQTISTDFVFYVSAGNQPPPNNRPVINAPSVINVLVNKPTDVAIPASDPDGDAIEFSATGLPSGLSIDPISGRVTGTPGIAGTFTATIRVTDARGASTTALVDFNATFGGLPAVASLSLPPLKAGVAKTFTPTIVNGVGATIQWDFGDGTKDTDYTNAFSRTHTYNAPGIYAFKITLRAPDGRLNVFQASQAVYPAGLEYSAAAATTGSAMLWDGALLWIANRDNDSVTAIDTDTRRRVKEIKTGDSPEGIAISPDEKVWVVNRESATITIIDPGSMSVQQQVRLPRGSRPFDIVFRNDGAAVVSLEALNELAIVGTDGSIFDRIRMPGPVRSLAYDKARNRVLASRFVSPPVPGESTAKVNLTKGSGVVYAVSGAAKLAGTIRLSYDRSADSEASGRGLPNYVGAVAIAPDGRFAWVPSKKDNIGRGKMRDGFNLDFQNSVRAIVTKIDLATGREVPGGRIDLDNASLARAAVFHPTGAYLFVALETSREVAVIDPVGGRELFRFSVGRAPSALAVAPDGKTLFVHNFMDRSVSVVDLKPLVDRGQKAVTTLSTVRTIGSEKLPPRVLRGKQLFYDAADPRLARDGYLSCATCHDNAEGDGRTWDFTGFGEGLRNTPSLLGRGGMKHGFLHWSANFDEVQDFEGQIRSFAGGTGLMSNAQFFAGTRSKPLGQKKAGLSPDLDALAAYLTSLSTTPASPYTTAKGTLTAAQRQGLKVFNAEGCGTCHAAPRYTISGNASKMRNIGTIDKAAGKRLSGPLKGIDVPTLKGVGLTAPYLHDGSAATLADAIRKHKGVKLSKREMARLVQFLKAL